MIKAIQRAVGSLDDGYIGNQTMSDIALAVGADCFPLNVELYGQPCIIGKDIDALNPSGRIPFNAISGSFTWAGQPCSILIRDGQILCQYSCHHPQGKPESVLYKTRDGKVQIKRALTVSDDLPPSNVVWAVGGMGLLGNYNPAAEGFTGVYSDVLRRTNHTVLGYRNGMVYGVYCKNMTALQINALCRDKLKFEFAILLDGGHVAAINAVNSKINTSQKQFYAIKFI